MEDGKNETLSFVERMKLKAQNQQTFGGISHSVEAKIDATTCPNCGAGRAKIDGLTKCAYCGHEFLTVVLTDGIQIKKEDNSR